MKKLSIIVPVYGVEKYIEKCLNSILPQIDKENIELIIVNDGTKDNSMSIACGLVEGYSNVKIINQKNLGLSKARNNGLLSADGEYVWFIDSDDFINENSIKYLLNKLRLKPDILQLNYQFVYEDKIDPVPQVSPLYNNEVLTGYEVLKKGGIPAPAPFSIFKRSLLTEHNLLFKEGIYYEDSEFKPRATYFAKKIMWAEPIVYNYLQRASGNITSSFKLKNALDLIVVVKSLHEFSVSNAFEKECLSGFYSIISMNVNSLLLGVKKLNANDKLIVYEKFKSLKNIFVDMMKSCRIKYMLEGALLFLNPSIGIKIHSFIR